MDFSMLTRKVPSTEAAPKVVDESLGSLSAPPHSFTTQPISVSWSEAKRTRPYVQFLVLAAALRMRASNLVRRVEQFLVNS